MKGQSKTSEQRAVIHALNKGYKLEKPDPLTLNDEDFKFFCSIEGHDKPIEAKSINLSTGRPTCTDCGHAESARKNRKPSLSADEISEALLACEPSLTLEKWAGQNQKGEHLCKCSDEECAFVGSYAEREIIGGAKKVALSNHFDHGWVRTSGMKIGKSRYFSQSSRFVLMSFT